MLLLREYFGRVNMC